MRTIDKRLAKLERDTTKDTKANAGDAPVAWARLAQWAIAFYDVGGWDEGFRREKERGWYPDNYPYPGNGTGAIRPQWDQSRFYIRGRKGVRWLDAVVENRMLGPIYDYVAYLLKQGVSRDEILTWDVGAQCWDALFSEQDGTHANAHA
jgi:hypothetical protein